MSKSDDNTNELESYGVWVKNSTGNEAENSLDTSDELNLDDGGLDLPDFDDSDFSDMFKDDPQVTQDTQNDDFGDDTDTALSTDELANITGNVSVEEVEGQSEDIDFDTDSFAIDSSEPIFDDTEESAVEEPVIEESSDEISLDEEISVDEPVIEESAEEFSIDEPVIEESEETTEAGDAGDEEISLDDFMDGGFSDESVASGNNGFEPGAGPDAAASSGDTEELSLDDFMDGDSFDSAPAAAKEEEIVDEAPLDMDISFDDSADSVETEDNLSLENTLDDDYEEEETVEESSVETEEVSMDDFGSDIPATEETKTDENIDTEDVDLSDFGIDADAEETPIVQDVEEAKNKEKVVDYDLSVGNENTSAAPVVNEIKTDTAEVTEELTDISDAEAVEAVSSNSTPVDNSLLQQIVSELSSLKDEMNKLKTNIEEIKTHDNSSVAAGVAGAAIGAAAGAIAADIAIDDEPAKNEGGFFSEDDGDDTIALSGDELDNIINTAEFGDTVEANEEAEEETVNIAENAEEPVIEETAVEESEVQEEEAPAFEEVPVTEDTIIDEAVIQAEPEEEVDISDNIVSEETIIENAISTEADTSLNDINLEDGQSEEELSFDFNDEKLEEPEIDEFIPDGNEELYENEELPDEISIPKEDDLLVESTTSDFMDSVKETTDETIEETAEAAVEESIEEPADEIVEETIEETVEEPAAEEVTEESLDLTSDEGEDDIPTVDKLLTDMDDSAETAVEEPAADETVVEEPVIEESEVSSDTTESFAEVDNLDNNLSESNLSYLSKESDSSDNANSDLKQDIKSVLLYMDQLLENLPEDKIVEFAKSDEFVTYKKLFSELGLS